MYRNRTVFAAAAGLLAAAGTFTLIATAPASASAELLPQEAMLAGPGDAFTERSAVVDPGGARHSQQVPVIRPTRQ